MSIEQYAIRGGRAGRERLRILSRVLRPQTLALFHSAGVGEGMACLDMGCGGGDVSFELAMIAGPKGRVLGIDIDDEKLAIARDEASAKGLDNVEFRNADAMHDADEINAFDFTFARQLLCHVPDPAHVLKEMITYASPGGLVAVDDVDFSGYFCHPPSPAFDRYLSLLRQTMRSRGGNADIGPELPSLLIAAGLENVEMRVVQLAATQGEMKLIPPISMDNFTEAVVADGLANAREVKEITDALYAYAENPETVMSMPRHIQAWGRAPQD